MLSSCKDDMDYNEFINYDEEDIFTSFDRTEAFVTQIYSYLDYDFGNYGGAMLASATDEADYVWSSSEIHDFYNGAWSASNAKSDMWSTAYTAIRAVNYYLSEAADQTFADYQYNEDYSEEMTKYENYQYEVRFLRAYFYFNLVRQYGDVPFTTDVLTTDEANTLSRTSASTIFDFIVSECDDISNYLPVNYEHYSVNEASRVTRIAALALKARALLYEASPLFNENSDQSLWYDAAVASKDVIDSCDYNGISLGAYSDLWGSDSYDGSEMIFVRRLGEINSLESYNFPVGVEGGNSGNCPTQTLVDAYEMQATGKLWNESGSGYDAKNPYDGRDPRFEMTVAKNEDTGWPTYYGSELQTYTGGANGAPISGATTTGYYLKKYLDSSISLTADNTTYKVHSWITYRLGEFYLDYAEAAYNYLGSPYATDGVLTMTPAEAVNTIRSRSDVSMPDLPEDLSNDEFEEKYRNERFVELAFEGHRFWDVRRWKMGELFKTITCMQIEKNDDESYTYTRYEEDRSWDDKMYLFPIPDSERRKNGNLTQNEGW